MKYSKESLQVGKYVWDTFKEIVEKLRVDNVFPKEFSFTTNKSDDLHFSIYIVGNKVAGTDYERETWKSVPVVECSMNEYSPSHPTKPGQEWLRLRVNYSGSWGSDYGQMEHVESGLIKRHLQKAIETAIKDFTIQETI